MTIARAHSPEAGTRVGAYEIVRPLGEGGMASVYEARHVRLRKRVAIKIVHAAVARGEVALERTLREGRAASAVRHPNIVEVFEIGEHDGVPFLVMELLEGEDLAQLLRRVHSLEPTAVADTLLPVIAGVAAAHDAGVIHRDIKPSNIRLTRARGGEVVPKVVDFGISKIVDDADARAVTRTDAVLGTVHYLSPEQTRGARNATAQSDQYALGVVLYESLTGKRPFEGESSYELMHAIVTAPLRKPSAIVDGVPPALEEAIVRAMSRDPSARFATVRDLGRALLPFASPRVAERMATELDEARSSRRVQVSVAPVSFTPPTLGGTTFVSKEHRIPAAPPARRRALSAGAIVAAAAVLAFLPMLAHRTPAAALHSKGERPLRVLATPNGAPDASLESPPPETAHPPVATPTTSVKPEARPTPPRRPAPAVIVASATPATAPAAAPTLGRNGAPILE